MVKEFYNNSICKCVCLVLCLGVLDNVETFCLGKLPSLPEIILKAKQQTPAPTHPETSYQYSLFIVPVDVVMFVLCISLESEMQHSSPGLWAVPAGLEGAEAWQCLLGSLKGFSCQHRKASPQNLQNSLSSGVFQKLISVNQQGFKSLQLLKITHRGV